MKERKRKNTLESNGTREEEEISVLIPDKIDFKFKQVRRDKEDTLT